MAEERTKKLVIALYELFKYDLTTITTPEQITTQVNVIITNLCEVLFDLEGLSEELKDINTTNRLILIDSIAAASGASSIEARSITDLVLTILDTYSAFDT